MSELVNDSSFDLPSVVDDEIFKSLFGDICDADEADGVDMTEFEKRQLSYLKVQNMIAVDFLLKVGDNLFWAEDQVQVLRDRFDDTECSDDHDEWLNNHLGYLADDLLEVSEQIGQIIGFLQSSPTDQ